MTISQALGVRGFFFPTRFASVYGLLGFRVWGFRVFFLRVSGRLGAQPVIVACCCHGAADELLRTSGTPIPFYMMHQNTVQYFVLLL